MKTQVEVKPNSKTEEVSQEGDSFIVKVKEPPREAEPTGQSLDYWQSSLAFLRARSGFSAALGARIRLLKLCEAHQYPLGRGKKRD